VEGATVFSAGVARASGAVGVATGPTVPGGDGLVTAGGRVVTVVGRGPALEEAREQAYRAADRITFPGRQLRRDIGLQRVAINA